MISTIHVRITLDNFRWVLFRLQLMDTWGWGSPHSIHLDGDWVQPYEEFEIMWMMDTRL